MIRISTIFVAICMVLVAASLGLVLYSVAGISAMESAIVALTALTFMILYNAVSMRLRDRSDVGGQIADLSRGTADLARQVAEFGRRLALVEGRVVSANSANADRVQSVAGEIAELGVLVQQLALSVASHDDMLSSGAPAPAPANDPPDHRQTQLPFAAEASARSGRTGCRAGRCSRSARRRCPAAGRSSAQILAAVKNAIEANRIDIYLQPMVTLPQRKVRFYEAVTRLRDDNDEILTPDDFIGTAEAAGLMGRIDHMVMLRCVQVLRRLMVRNKEVGVFCNVAAATLSNPATFAQCLDFLEANRALAASFVLEFKQSTFRNLGPGRRPSTSRRWRSAATASPSTTSPICGSSRANSPTAACASSRFRRPCCSTSGRPRRPTFTPRTCPTCSAASASTLSPSGSRASVRWSTCSTMTCGSGRDSCSQHLGRCGPRRRLLPGPRTKHRFPMPQQDPLPMRSRPIRRASGNAALARRAVGPG